IALAIDDASMGAAGTTNPIGIATPRMASFATKDLDAYVVKGTTAVGWGMPPLANGIYAAVYHSKRTGPGPAAGVTLTLGSAASPPPTMVDMNRDFYFGAAATTRTTLDGAANATGANGTALLSGASLNELYSGKSNLPATCMWEIHAGAAIP